MKKWKTTLAIIFLLLATVLNQQWLWVILILLSIIHMLYEREIHFFERISMKEDPWHYWSLFSLLMLFELHELGSYLGVVNY